MTTKTVVSLTERSRTSLMKCNKHVAVYLDFDRTMLVDTDIDSDEARIFYTSVTALC